MLVSERSLKFQGFHPSEFTRAFLNQKINEIHGESPYGSTLRAMFTKKNKIFKGVITIHSSAGEFIAVASGHKMKQVSRKLVEQIRKQLKKWKSKRFEHVGVSASPLDEEFFQEID